MSQRHRLLAQRQVALVVCGLPFLLSPPSLDSEGAATLWPQALFLGLWAVFILLIWLIGRVAAGGDS